MRLLGNADGQRTDADGAAPLLDVAGKQRRASVAQRKGSLDSVVDSLGKGLDGLEDVLQTLSVADDTKRSAPA